MIHIIGAGFTGLTLAWELRKLGLPVTIYEKNQVGGLIHSSRTKTHLRETAANGVLWTPRLEALAKELQVEFQPSQQSAKKRYIFHNGKARRWPLGLIETIKFIVAVVSFAFKKLFFKKELSVDLTLEQWGMRSLSKPFTDVVLSAGVQGIFAVTPEHLNAKAVLNSFKVVAAFKKSKKYKPVTYAPLNGMGELIQVLEQRLQDKDVKFEFKEIRHLTDLNLSERDAVVMATPAWDAHQILPEAGLGKIKSVPLTSLTLVWSKDEPVLDGFGCLFPPVDQFFAAGVLVNSGIFAHRGPNPSESWIMSHDLENLTPDQIIEKILDDRRRLFPQQGEPLECHLTNWTKAIPAYDHELQKFLENLPNTEVVLAKQNVYLSGNYLGKIGLAKIYDQNIVLAEKLKVNYG